MLPIMEEHSDLLYMKKKSNHPALIIKKIPSMNSKCISNICYNNEQVNKIHLKTITLLASVCTNYSDDKKFANKHLI